MHFTSHVTVKRSLRWETVGWLKNVSECYSERSEESDRRMVETLRSAQGDRKEIKVPLFHSPTADINEEGIP